MDFGLQGGPLAGVDVGERHHAILAISSLVTAGRSPPGAPFPPPRCPPQRPELDLANPLRLPLALPGMCRRSGFARGASRLALWGLTMRCFGLSGTCGSR